MPLTQNGLTDTCLLPGADYAGPLLAVRDLRVGFRQEGQWVSVINGVSFDIGRGESFALVGESGSGKSISALSVLRLLPPNAQIMGGSVALSGVNLFAVSELAMRSIRGRRIAMVFQDAMSALNPVMTIRDQIGETLYLHHGLKGVQLRQRALELLDQVGLPDPIRQLAAYPYQLSGGMRQRAMIALALAGEPELLIADEPTTALDVTLQAQILELLQRLRKETAMALWMITHDFATVAEIADRIAVMRSGVLVETSGPEFFERPQESYSRELLAVVPKLNACLSNNQTEKYRNDTSLSPPLLEVRNLKVFYPIKRGLFRRTVDCVRAVDDVSFQLMRGETLAFVGESGCGKTSLGKALLGLIRPTAGRVVLRGRNLTYADSNRRTAGFDAMQIVFQDPASSMNPRMVAGQILEEGLRAQRPGMTAAERRERAEALMLSVGLAVSSWDKYPHEFSGGQRQRLCIARALAVEPALIICDEPTSALDVSVQAQVIQLMKDLQAQSGVSYLFISHDLALVSGLADRVAVMKEGKIVEMGKTQQVIYNPAHSYTQMLLNALPSMSRR